MNSERKPNLLFVFTDEQAAKTMKTYGNDMIQTPNMDRLASESIVFKNAYVTQPVCTPSRSTLLTGLYPHTNGCIENNIPLEQDTPCFPELGDFSGYKTAYYGKWHLGDELYAQHGFDDWISIEDGYNKYFSEGKDKSLISSYSGFLIKNGFEPDITRNDGSKVFSRQFAARLPEEYGKPAFLARESCRFIKENQDNPFILFVNFLEPHMPYFGPRDNQYNPDEIPLPENFYHELSAKNPLKTRLYRSGYYKRGHSGLPLKTEQDWKRMIANYWGLVSVVDTQLGRIMDTIEKCGLKEDTIIVYTSDHGDMMGAHRLLAKCTMFEEAVKVPMFLKIPGKEPQVVENPVSQIDLVPTLLDVMGQEIPCELQGRSLLPCFQGEESFDRDVFIEWNSANCGFGDQIGKAQKLDCWKKLAHDEEIESALRDPVRTVVTSDGWKYNWSKRGEDELYYLKDDPGETVNLAYKSRYDNFVKELRQKIMNWQNEYGDRV